MGNFSISAEINFEIVSDSKEQAYQEIVKLLENKIKNHLISSRDFFIQVNESDS